MIPRVRSPELPQNYPWLNTVKPLSLKSLKGRIVILDFWTYCCVNCLHILPDLKYLERKYQDSLTIIGVHSGKFDNEKEIESIRQAILRYEIEHPVLVDNNFLVWENYTVRAWPTLIIIDPQGYVIGQFAGEGHLQAIENVIIQLQQKNQAHINFQQFQFTLEKQHQPLITPLAFPGKVLATSSGLFIADSGHHRIVMTRFDGKILYVIGTGKSGLTDGAFNQVQFSAPQGMTFDDESQILYIADTENYALRQIDLQRQVVETIAGTGQQNHIISPHGGVALETALNSPWDLQKVGNKLLIAMAGSHQIWEMDLERGTIETFAGTGAEGCFDSTLTECAFAQPSGITTNGQELFIADSEVSSIRGVELDEQGKVRTICGSGMLFGFGDMDGEKLDVRLQHCLGVEYFQNYLWVADTYNHKIKLVHPTTGNCQTVLGDGLPGFQDGQGKNTRFSEPSGLSGIDSYLYISDTNNHAIRRVNLKTLTVQTLDFPGLCAPSLCLSSHISAF
ncbi:redoxin domain-containing protein [Anabaena cylindrica FACHB-243]|uniref:NHL repeat containing protein n=1 Tax=Anabaena cylindrica (strain ATCC 27899 / PCC 7122) TaxID=272123 RepID=K9ZMH5_ANACC|nr:MULTISPECIES: thioredoxin-like domain-containing protein [Anabaena]AFZ59727.1 NHL repeat containing protein [Anabaena cylindrica PCC 7122]MBD2418612.1 redoxin domain-containing protein [Anabaena cylindrica FACHB-243]MBY5283355.1 redoxin domain-containing protein [Anabaena sp. CCAP 1446/1C]MBY5307790.1 redoxin domain-containing protein [Anabaena sp. CCAP 1446/1C]MCM2406172.1 redoxin domain-containing protein [Anabaena sp. CCAP 1446/1C]